MDISKLRTRGVSDSELREQIELLSQQTPRFLFRAWSEKSGGDPRLNTPKAITPHAFLNQKGPSSIYDVPQQQLAILATLHFTGQRCESVFSSWSQSIGFVIAEAFYRLMGENVYISIIDTKRLPSRNVILYTAKMGFLSDTIRIPAHFVWEYLAFGIIAGDAHRAVPLREFLSRGYKLDKCGPEISLLNKIKRSRELGRLYGQHFELPITVYLLSLRETMVGSDGRSFSGSWKERWTDGERSFVLSKLQTLNIPEEWCEDQSILALNRSILGGYADAALAIEMLADLVNAKKEKWVNGQLKRSSATETKRMEVSDAMTMTMIEYCYDEDKHLGKLRRPRITDMWWATTEERWGELPLSRKTVVSNVGRIMEMDGREVKHPCQRCLKRKRPCWVYKADASAKYKTSLKKICGASARCRWTNTKCEFAV